MKSKTIAAIAGVLLVAPFCATQNSKELQAELVDLYVGRSYENYQPYLNREVWYDQEGNITEHPTPVCDNLYGNLEVTGIRVRGDEIDVEATRSGKRAPSSYNKPVWPTYASRDIVLRFKSPHDPWTAEKFDRAFQNSLQPRGHLQLPPGATNPPPGSDTRIAYILDGAPVYRPGGGVTAPRQIRRSDPTYTDSARRARAGGTVLLRFIVNEDGSVSNLTTAQPPLGFGLDEQAARMADRWQFSPATLEGQPVKADIRAETSFCLY